MFDLDKWQEIFNSLGKNPLRTFLTAFGVGWGIFMLIVMMGAGNGLSNGVTSEFQGTATNSFFMWAQRTSKPYRGFLAGRWFGMDLDDYEAIKRNVPEAKVIAPRNQLGGYQRGNNVTRGSKSGTFNVMGDFPQITQIEGIIITKGRFVNELDIEDRRKIAIIGTRVRDILFEKGEDPIGQSIKIQGIYFKIAGIFKTKQSGDQAERDTQRIFIPFTTFQHAFNYGNRVNWFAIRSQDNIPVSFVEDKVIALLKRRHKIAPDDERAFGHFNIQKEYSKITGLFTGITILVWIVGIGTLAAGMIGVSNIMLVIVKERTQEIGIRRAIGAKPWSIISQIILESLTLTGISGYIGMVLGIGTLELVNAALGEGGGGMMFQNPDVDLSLILRAFAILVVAGVIAGLIPAQRAVSISTVDALRSE